MKVALVSTYCLDSTMPLAKHLADQNIETHLFGLMPQYNQNVFVVDFSNSKQPNGFIKSNILSKKMGSGLCEYLALVKSRFFIFPAGSGKKTFFSDIYYAYKFCNYLIKHRFDVIHLIHTGNRFSLLLMHILKKQNLIQTLHEVTAHNGDTNYYDIRILKTLIANNIPIIFHSNISMDRFLEFRSSVTSTDFNKTLYKMLRFSLYETYSHFLPEKDKIDLQSTDRSVPIILHFGRIVPYKGIDILIDAIKIIQKKQPVHLIVAGEGDPYFNFDEIISYEFINYSISNEEIIELITKCTLVVCPYRSASQSGIPMSVFPFNKPIIVSNMEGFKDIVDHNITGLVVEKMDPVSFAEAIESLISNKALRKQMALNIEKKFREGDFFWPNIAKATKNFYNMSLNKNIKLP